MALVSVFIILGVTRTISTIRRFIKHCCLNSFIPPATQRHFREDIGLHSLALLMSNTLSGLLPQQFHHKPDCWPRANVWELFPEHVEQQNNCKQERNVTEEGTVAWWLIIPAKYQNTSCGFVQWWTDPNICGTGHFHRSRINEWRVLAFEQFRSLRVFCVFRMRHLNTRGLRPFRSAVRRIRRLGKGICSVPKSPLMNVKVGYWEAIYLLYISHKGCIRSRVRHTRYLPFSPYIVL